MATLKQRLNRKNSSGTYDTVHLETSSEVVKRPSGETVENDLTNYLPKVQNSDSVPESLKLGQSGREAFTSRKEPNYGYLETKIK